MLQQAVRVWRNHWKSWGNLGKMCEVREVGEFGGNVATGWKGLGTLGNHWKRWGNLGKLLREVREVRGIWENVWS